MTDENIFILSAYEKDGTYGDVIQTSIDNFQRVYESQTYPKFIMIPVLRDPSGVMQYVKVNADRLVYTFRSCIIKYRLRVEYMDAPPFRVKDKISPNIEDDEVSILKEVVLEIHDFIELYQAFWNISRFSALNILMNRGGTFSSVMNVSDQEAYVTLPYRALDFAEYSIEIKNSNLGNVSYHFPFHKKPTCGSYILSEVICRELHDFIHSTEDDYDTFSLSGPIFVDQEFENWAITESYDEVHADGEYFYPVASGAYILSSAIDYKFLSNTVYYKTYSSNIDLEITIFDTSKEMPTPENLYDMVGIYSTEEAIVDRFIVYKTDLSLLMEFLTDIHFIAEALVLYAKTIEPNLSVEDVKIEFDVFSNLRSEISTKYMRCSLETDKNFPNESMLVQYLKAVEDSEILH